jgi:phosphonate transport system substrate-binding protein
MKYNMALQLAGCTQPLFRYGVSWCTIMLLIMLSPAILSPASATGPAQGAALELGMAPFLPARTLVQNYRPMRAYLEQQLEQPVIFVTAPDYKTFYERIQRHEYPIIITVANLAYLASAEAGYVPMLRPLIDTCPVLVVSKNSSLARVQDLRGKTVALPDPLAIISMQGVEMLRESGLDPAKDVNLRHLPNHSAAVNHVISGEAAAAIISDRALLQMPTATQQSVRVVQKWEKAKAPGVVYLASPALPPQRVAQLTGVILKFTRDTPEGRELINKLGYGGLIPATARDLEPLAPFGEMFKETIVSSNKKKNSKLNSK